MATVPSGNTIVATSGTLAFAEQIKVTLNDATSNNVLQEIDVRNTNQQNAFFNSNTRSAFANESITLNLATAVAFADLGDIGSAVITSAEQTTIDGGTAAKVTLDYNLTLTYTGADPNFQVRVYENANLRFTQNLALSGSIIYNLPAVGDASAHTYRFELWGQTNGGTVTGTAAFTDAQYSTMGSLEATVRTLADQESHIVSNDLSNRVQEKADTTTVTTLSSTVTTLNTNVTSLTTDVTTAEGNITALQGNVTSLQTSVNTIEPQIDQINSVPEPQARLSSNLTDFDNHLSITDVPSLQPAFSDASITLNISSTTIADLGDIGTITVTSAQQTQIDDNVLYLFEADYNIAPTYTGTDPVFEVRVYETTTLRATINIDLVGRIQWQIPVRSDDAQHVYRFELWGNTTQNTVTGTGSFTNSIFGPETWTSLSTDIQATFSREAAALWDEDRSLTRLFDNYFQDISGVTVNVNSESQFFANPLSSDNTGFPGRQSYTYGSTVISNTVSNPALSTGFQKLYLFDYINKNQPGTRARQKLFQINPTGRELLAINASNELVLVQGDEQGSNVSESYNNYLSLPRSSYLFQGSTAQTANFIISATGTYTFEGVLNANNGTDTSISTTVTINVTDLTADISASTATMSFTIDGDAHTQSVSIQYVSSFSYLSQTFNAIRLTVTGISESSDFTVDSLRIRAYQSVTRTFQDNTSYSDLVLETLDDEQSGSIALLLERTLTGGSAANPFLSCKIIHNGRIVDFSTNTRADKIIDIKRQADDLVQTSLQFGDTLVLPSRIQVYSYNISNDILKIPSFSELLNMYNQRERWLGLFDQADQETRIYNLDSYFLDQGPFVVYEDDNNPVSQITLPVNYFDYKWLYVDHRIPNGGGAGVDETRDEVISIDRQLRAINNDDVIRVDGATDLRFNTNTRILSESTGTANMCCIRLYYNL